MKNLMKKMNNGEGNNSHVKQVERARKRSSELYFKTLTLAEHVYRKAQTDIFIANNKNKNKDFEVLSNICDRYSGWLNDDDTVWWFIDGSEIRWNHERGEPELLTNKYEVWSKYW